MLVAGLPEIFTVGYQGLLQSQLIELLRAARVQSVLDIRAVAASRKIGFSKTLLGASMAAGGLTYVHDPRLGTPKAGRQAARARRIDDMRAVFTAHMRTDAAQAALDRAVGHVSGSATCLLCFETDPHDCHRSIVATMLRAKTGQTIRHL